MQHYAGIEIGGTKLQIVVGDEQANIRARRKIAVARDGGAAAIRQHIQKELPALLADFDIKAIGVGFGGPVNWKTAHISRSHQVEGWSEFNLRGWLGTLSKAPVFADNDANVAALGEARKGQGQGLNPVFYVTLGSGVGGGLIVDGRIYHGAQPGEAEIGHLRMDRQGTILESRCSGWAVDTIVREAAIKNPESILGRAVVAGPGAEARHLAGALDQGDPVAQKILEDVASDLGFGLSHVAHLFHPQMIVLGGGLSWLGERLRSQTEQVLQRFVMGAFAPGPKIGLAALAEDAVPVGALVLAQELS